MLFSFRDNVYINIDRSEIPHYFLNQIELVILKMSAEKREAIDFKESGIHLRQNQTRQVLTLKNDGPQHSALSLKSIQEHKRPHSSEEGESRTCFQGSRGYEHIKCHLCLPTTATEAHPTPRPLSCKLHMSTKPHSA